MPGGREPKYRTSSQLKKAVGRYYKYVRKNNLKPTVSGMAYFLGFSDRSSIRDMAEKSVNPSFAHVIKRAYLKLEDDRIQRLLAEGGQKVGIIFEMKNIFGWIDERHNLNETVQHESTIDDLESKRKAQIRPIKRTGTDG